MNNIAAPDKPLLADWLDKNGVVVEYSNDQAIRITIPQEQFLKLVYDHLTYTKLMELEIIRETALYYRIIQYFKDIEAEYEFKK